MAPGKERMRKKSIHRPPHRRACLQKAHLTAPGDDTTRWWWWRGGKGRTAAAEAEEGR